MNLNFLTKLCGARCTNECNPGVLHQRSAGSSAPRTLQVFVSFSRSQPWRVRRSLIGALLIGCCLLGLAGCQQSGNSTNRYSSRPLFDLSRRPAWLGGSGTQLAQNDPANSDARDIRFGASPGAGVADDMNQRLGAFDNDNQLLNTEVASLQQRLDMANRYSQQLKDQLAGTTGQMSQVFAEREAAQQQIASLRIQLDQATQNLQLAQQRAAGSPQLASAAGGIPAQLAGGAVLRANNSLMQKLSAIQIRGAQARMDGDVIRIEFPSDSTFVPGTYQIQPAQLPLIQSVAGTLAQQFPRQIVGVEAHWDNSPLGAGDVTDHQLTATQSLAVFNELVRLGVPRKQLFTMAMASNRPRHAAGVANGVSPNRRIEIVIYPETFDGS